MRDCGTHMPFTFEYHELIIGNILVVKENQNAEDPFFLPET